VAGRFTARLLGLSALSRARAGPGLLIPRCRSVHTFGMRFDLDLVFLAGNGEVLRIDRAVPAGRIRGCAAAAAVLEIPSRATAKL
jgi:uncharacterized protein